MTMKVMGWPAFSNKAVNPYTSLLYEGMQRKGAEVVEYTGPFRNTGRFDVLHVHWPDYELRNPSWVKAYVRCLIFFFVVLRAKLRGTRIVWTAHNLQSHECRHPQLEKLFWQALLPLLDGVISLSDAGIVQVREKKLGDRKIPVGSVAHGHYRDCYPNQVSREKARAKFGLDAAALVVAWIGQIRPYKGLEELVSAWARIGEADRALLIGGLSSDPGLTQLLEESAQRDGTIRFYEGRVEDGDLQFYFNAADVVVMPYRKILNSGSALLALSFNRPVVLPRSPVMEELRARVGADWVYLYEGEFNDEVLRQVFAWLKRQSRPERAPLSSLDWDVLAEQTLVFYGEVIGKGKRTPDAAFTLERTSAGRRA